MENNSTYVINIDYCGTCYGTCQGCLLTEDERQQSTPFFNLTTSKNALEKIIKNLDNTTIEHLVIAFGRGNTLSLSDENWDDIYKTTTYLLENIKHHTHTIECSTSLIGKIEYHINYAKKIITQFNKRKLNLRFVVVCNTDLMSENYWRNLDLFLTSLQQHRGDRDGDGDVLNLSLYSDNLPSLNFIQKKILHYKFPVNLIFLPFNKISLSNYDILAEWLKDFSDYVTKNELDVNLVNVIKNSLTKPPTIVDAIEYSKINTKNFIWLQKDLQIDSGSFTLFGDVDLTRLSNKLNININPNDILQKFTKIKPCKTCNYLPVCIYNSSHIQAFYNDAKNPCNNKCPNGLKLLYENLICQ